MPGAVGGMAGSLEPTLAVVSKLSGSWSLSSNWGVQGQVLRPGEGMCKNWAGARSHRFEFHGGTHMLIRNPGPKSNGCAHQGQSSPPFSHSSKTNSRPHLPGHSAFHGPVQEPGEEGSAGEQPLY